MANAIYTIVAEFMTDSVSFYPKSSVDKYNKPTFGSLLTVTGRLIYGQEKNIDAQGVEVIDVGRFITYGPSTSLTTNHKMVVDGESFIIHNVSDIKDENGAHHTVVRFGR
jgi:hypothetical protein